MTGVKTADDVDHRCTKCGETIKAGTPLVWVPGVDLYYCMKHTLPA